MHVIIIDTTGSVPSTHQEAGFAFASELIKKIDPRHEIVCVMSCPNFDGGELLRNPIQTIVRQVRGINPHCVIHLITDGFIMMNEVEHVDHIWVYSDNTDSLTGELKRRVVGLVEVPEVVKTTHEEPPTLLDPMKEIRETAEAALDMLRDETKYKEHRERIYELFPGLRELEEQFNEFDKRMEESNKKWAEENPVQAACDHGVSFDYEAAKDLGAYEVRKRWPRLMGPCPKGCGFNGIGYASYTHYICGDW